MLLLCMICMMLGSFRIVVLLNDSSVVLYIGGIMMCVCSMLGSCMFCI